MALHKLFDLLCLLKLLLHEVFSLFFHHFARLEFYLEGFYFVDGLALVLTLDDHIYLLEEGLLQFCNFQGNSLIMLLLPFLLLKFELHFQNLIFSLFLFCRFLW